MKIECRECGKFKTRLKSDRKTRCGKHFYYVNETGRLWNGHQCPQCKVVKASKVWATDSHKTKSRIDDEYIYC